MAIGAAVGAIIGYGREITRKIGRAPQSDQPDFGAVEIEPPVAPYIAQ